MKVNITNGQLLAWHNERQQLTGTLMENLMRNKINDFYSKNQQRIITAVGERDKIYKEFFAYDDTQIKMDDGKPVMQDGKLFEDAQKAINDFSAEKTVIDI